MAPEQRKIREFDAKIIKIERKRYSKKGYSAFGVRPNEQFTLIKRLKERYLVTELCQVFTVHRSSFKYWLKRLNMVDIGKLKAMTR